MNKVVATAPVYTLVVDRFISAKEIVDFAVNHLAVTDFLINTALEQTKPKLSKSEIKDLSHSLKVIKVTLSEFKKLQNRLESDIEHFLYLMQECTEDQETQEKQDG